MREALLFILPGLSLIHIYEVLAIDSDEGRVNDAIDMVTDAQIGDATNEHFVESLGVGNFDLCVVCLLYTSRCV